ncbi:MAG: hypothetical protein GXC73_19630 [Chitinophagaceae bacterium]|nr:hypothetical protein [Chitinophagaceae bacterium]
MTEIRYDQYGYKRKKGKRSPRPMLITILCVALFAWGMGEIVFSYTGNTALNKSGVDTLYPAINALMMVFSFVALSGTWTMEKWGPISFVIVVTLKLFVDLLFGHFNPLYLLAYIPAVVFLLNLKKMRKTD